MKDNKKKKNIGFPKSQCNAIKAYRRIASTIVNTKDISEVFLSSMENIPLGSSRASVIKSMTGLHPRIGDLSNNTLKSAARDALKRLVSEKDYKRLTKKAQQDGGKVGIKYLQAANGTISLTDPEKKVLNAIGENPAEYKKNTVWNIQKIQEEIAKVIDFPRSDSTIKEYMRKNFSLPPKKLILWADHPEEVAYLKELFDTYYEVGKKLPTCDIKNQLNARFHHQRTQFAVENYIRAHFKSSEERQLQDNPLRTNEEKNFIRNIIAHKSEYTYSSTSHGGGYNLTKILGEFQKQFPESTRNKKGIKHQLFKLERKVTS